jgi:surface antigen
MKKIRLLSLLFLFAITGCSTPEPFHHQYASGHYSSDIEQCAIYARSVSTIKLYGNADSWWQEAAGHYSRGNKPVIGSVLVLKKTHRMHAGHVAVVKNILSARKINVTHSNWGDSRSSRHIIYDSMLVEDVSAANDWSQVRFWNDAKGVMGFPYQAYGFIYP